MSWCGAWDSIKSQQIDQSWRDWKPPSVSISLFTALGKWGPTRQKNERHGNKTLHHLIHFHLLKRISSFWINSINPLCFLEEKQTRKWSHWLKKTANSWTSWTHLWLENEKHIQLNSTSIRCKSLLNGIYTWWSVMAAPWTETEPRSWVVTGPDPPGKGVSIIFLLLDYDLSVRNIRPIPISLHRDIWRRIFTTDHIRTNARLCVPDQDLLSNTI